MLLYLIYRLYQTITINWKDSALSQDAQPRQNPNVVMLSSGSVAQILMNANTAVIFNCQVYPFHCNQCTFALGNPVTLTSDLSSPKAVENEALTMTNK